MTEYEAIRFEYARDLVSLLGAEIIKYTKKSKVKADSDLKNHLDFIDGKISFEDLKKTLNE